MGIYTLVRDTYVHSWPGGGRSVQQDELASLSSFSFLPVSISPSLPLSSLFVSLAFVSLLSLLFPNIQILYYKSAFFNLLLI